MKKTSLWNRPADRVTFAFTAIASLLCIYLFPTFLNNFLFSYIQGAEGSAARMVFRALLTPIAVLFFSIPLLIVTRRRLLDLQLSGVFLFAFPIWPLIPLALGYFWLVALFPLGKPAQLLMSADIWLGIFCLLFFIFLPGRLAGGTPKWPVFQKLQRMTETHTRIDAAQFRKKARVFIPLLIALPFLQLLINPFYSSTLFIILSHALKITLSLLVLIITAHAIRRLNDIGRSYLWSALIPLFMPRIVMTLSALPFMAFKGNNFTNLLRTLTFGSTPLLFPMLAGCISCIALLIYLVRKKSSTSPQVPPETVTPESFPLHKEAFFTPAKFILGCLAAMMITATIVKIYHPYDYYRYRMTVTIETPEGLKTGYAVRQGNYEQGSKNRASWAVGEAVVVDLGERGQVFALIDNGNIGDGVSYTTTCNLPEFGRKETPIGKRWVLSLGEYPKLVTFTDPRNPKTMQSLLSIKGNSYCGKRGKWEIQEDRFEDVFGQGVRLKEISLEITGSPVTSEIEKHLPWLHCKLTTKLQKPRFMQKTILDKGGFKRYSREHNLKKMRSTEKDTEPAICAELREEWVAYDRQKFQNELDNLRPDAELGDAKAQFELGKLLEEGDGQDIVGDYMAAMQWYLRAAEGGYQIAQIKLAEAYKSKKLGMLYNPSEAYYWASLAALSAPGEMETNLGLILRNLAEQLTPEEQAATDKRIKAWVPPPTEDGSENKLMATQADLSKRLLDFVYEGNVETVKLLVERGADINAQNSGGNTPLMLAIIKKRQDIVVFLINKNANINTLNNQKWNALSMAAHSGNTEAAKLLLEKGIDATIKDTTIHQRTAQEIAKNKGYFVIADMIAEHLK